MIYQQLEGVKLVYKLPFDFPKPVTLPIEFVSETKPVQEIPKYDFNLEERITLEEEKYQQQEEMQKMIQAQQQLFVMEYMTRKNKKVKNLETSKLLNSYSGLKTWKTESTDASQSDPNIPNTHINNEYQNTRPKETPTDLSNVGSIQNVEMNSLSRNNLYSQGIQQGNIQNRPNAGIEHNYSINYDYVSINQSIQNKSSVMEPSVSKNPSESGNLPALPSYYSVGNQHPPEHFNDPNRDNMRYGLEQSNSNGSPNNTVPYLPPKPYELHTDSPQNSYSTLPSYPYKMNQTPIPQSPFSNNGLERKNSVGMPAIPPKPFEISLHDYTPGSKILDLYKTSEYFSEPSKDSSPYYFGSGNITTEMGSSNSNQANKPSKPDAEEEEVVEQVQDLICMGFTKAQAIFALEKYSYDVEKATNYLLDNS
ncbi:hypothetical protein BB559_005770 [Furculomyces boomerangus]|uniref:UBA domain-containing protein n=1 Tax=Furculomyces boomerangus TaxID=61424 RepID=A0A2T9Y6Q8_9FUNG|nr:hypothetical protein BB559_005770 [Furculomyces boomerangus]